MHSSWSDVWQQVNAADETNGERWSTVSDFPSRMAQAFYTYHIKPLLPPLPSSPSLPPLQCFDPFLPLPDTGEHGSLAPSILDIGCGQLSNARYFSQKGLRVVGVDKSPLHPTGPLPPIVGPLGSVTFYVADACELPFSDAAFDFVFSDGVLYYGDIDFFLAALTEADRVLRIGGTLRFNVKSSNDMHFFSESRELIEPVDIRQVIARKGWEAGLPILGFGESALRELLVSQFPRWELKIGMEYFHYTSTDASNLHCFLVVTAVKT